FRKECNDAHILLQVHDELVTECQSDEAEKVQTIVTEEMRKGGELWLKKVPTGVDSYISDTWEK
ncbi:MAG: bifunctional 3'-5' exonuclease/DNA polymerase, partial [Gammaproteobacteria bacterium]|nr:bifunctional 3'-5' exonuclease/DNA polymerase [Gammaproteobacteria bacterium]